MKKILLIIGIILSVLTTEAQTEGYKQKLERCNIELIPEINSEGKLTYSQEFQSKHNKEDNYYYIKRVFERRIVVEKFIVDDEKKGLIIYEDEIFDGENICTIYKVRITLADFYYKVEISDITFAKVKFKNQKRKLYNKETLESFLHKKEPDCKILKDLSTSIQLSLKQHRLGGIHNR